MQTVLKYRGRRITESEVSFLRELIARHPEANRRALSLEVCAAWDWKQLNGHPCDAVCRGLLLALHRAGQITLPPPQRPAPARRRPPAVQSAVPVAEPPVRTALKELGPLSLRQVRRTEDEGRFDQLIAGHHYLGQAYPVGEHLKYLFFGGGRPVACFLWTSAPRHLGPRDRFIGWSPSVRRGNIHLIAYNSRFLILPWVEVPHLASHLLGWMARILPGEWEQMYHHPVHLAETFVDRTHWRGTCYRAANWICVGQTTGRGKDDRTHRANRAPKDVLVYPLTRPFRAELTRPR